MNLKLATAAAAASVLIGPPKPADAHCASRSCRARVAHRECSQTRPRACVLHVIYHQHITGWQRAWMLRVPACESGWNPYAYFRHPFNRAPAAVVFEQDISTGVYAFKPSTWATTPYGRRSIWSAFWQPYAAAWMLRRGRSSEWSCG